MFLKKQLAKCKKEINNDNSLMKDVSSDEDREVYQISPAAAAYKMVLQLMILITKQMPLSPVARKKLMVEAQKDDDGFDE
jgi:phage terminase small subunit